MLAPVGIGITGALLIVGVLYSIRMIHRKRRNSFKHQRRKVRQPEVRALPSHPSSPSSSHGGLVPCVRVSRCRFILPSNLESRGRAVRTKPCCWPTAPRTSSDETLSGGRGRLMLLLHRREGWKEAYCYDDRILHQPRGCWCCDSCDSQNVTERRAQICTEVSFTPRPNPTPPVKYQREHFSDCCQVTLKALQG